MGQRSKWYGSIYGQTEEADEFAECVHVRQVNPVRAVLVCPTFRIKPRGTIRRATAALESRRYLPAVID